MTARKIYTFKLNDSTPNDHPGRVGEITYRDGYLYYHDGVTLGGELISGGGGSGGPTTWTSITGMPSFAAVATSGAYADLTGKPALFTANQTLNTGDSVSFNRLTVTGASGIEGGEIELAKAPNSTIAGNVIIDVYEDKLRFFEGGGNGRGFYLDLTTGANNTSTNIMSGGGGSDHEAYEITNTNASGTTYSVSVGTDGMISFPVIDGERTLWGAVDEDFNIKTTRTEPGIDADISIISADDIWMEAGDDIDLKADGTVRITSDNAAAGPQWQFGTDGTLTLPTSNSGVGIIQSPAGIWLDANGMLLQFSSNGSVDFPSVNGTTSLIRSTTSTTINSNGKEWYFGQDGDLTAPRNIILNNPVTTVTETETGTIADSNANPFTFRILKSANPQLVIPFSNPNFVLKWTAGDAGSLAAAAQAPGGHGVSSLVSDDGTYWNFNSWYGLGGNRPNTGTVFTVEYGVVDSDTMISTTSTNLVIEADAKQYRFGTDGNITLPSGGTISEGGGFTGAIRLTPAGGANEYQALVIYPTVGDGDHIHLTAGGGTTDLYLGSDLQYVQIQHSGHVVVQAADGVDNSQWLFNKNGDLTLPAGGDIKDSNGASVLFSGSYADLTNKPSLLYRQVAAPATSKGVAGNLVGDIAFDNLYIYYCVADYTTGVADIWKRMAFNTYNVW